MFENNALNEIFLFENYIISIHNCTKMKEECTRDLWGEVMKFGDRILILVIVIVSTVMIGIQYSSSDIPTHGPLSANITIDGKLLHNIELTEDVQEIEIKTDRGYDLLRVSEFGIQVIASDCPKKICMSYGQINKPGEIIVCLPNRMLVEVIGNVPLEKEIDAIVY